jgi:translation initiation factor IF-3
MNKNRINEMIRVSPIRLIDERGEQLGIIETSKALQMAKEKELALVEVSPHAKPPVCKIIDWGKYQYLESKKDKKQRQKQKKVEIKGVRIRPSTGENDLNFKIKKTEEFLTKGKKVKIEIILRGREKAFMGQARGTLQEFVDKINFPIKIEQDIKKQFNGFNIVVSGKDS